MEKTVLVSLKHKIDSILSNNTLPFWSEKMIDNRDGGFYGRIDKDGKIEADAPKGVILNTRLLWSFSRAYGYTKEQKYKDLAGRSASYIREHFIDPEFGGLYWTVDSKGRSTNNRKQSYAQAFGIYAFSEYYKISNEEQAKTDALNIFEALEKHARDYEYGGYVEALSREWEDMEDLRLSDVDQNDKKSNNTHLHIMEAYTTLHEICGYKKTAEALESVTLTMMEKIYKREKRSFTLFFTEDWQSRSETMSYGHDIEASWLVWEALQTLNNGELTKRYRADVLEIAQNALDNYLDGTLGSGGMNNELHADGTLDRDKIWWVQNEAVIGFLNAYELSGAADFLSAAQNIWNFCDKHHVDHKDGEWWGFAKDDGVTSQINPYKADEWKCPYHNSRACIESLERIEKLIK
ncbi:MULTISPECIES: AGE family epimerase/isomerase [unclassified Oceanispirochaeta]|uniref:AGE family epimerase/isomerase n=1 Tax=unclassified Oceanispirochaeta TaxID=2635722 RepID=UPI000E093917|nr:MULTISPECIES: AGE family epimerase/isomerase [unclassified Oceanispirochaeta]MBF9018379.1 AGE family epimerase/isomerase [Oceanispirochaeta sp. M2]NPD74817.1 N-acyl-D-glucosamine 2-epimerase [Oceanispirochaeta sp. M1]RDG29310.1 N-acyl-D-glucosamine 2-epimerase [Oceanispirochaeta sp. M1]